MQVTRGFATIPMGDKCQSRFKYVPEVPEATRTAQLWHLRYHTNVDVNIMLYMCFARTPVCRFSDCTATVD